MKTRFCILVFIPLLYCVSCERQTNNCLDLIQSSSIAGFPMDLYGVNDVEVIGEELHINVNYGGGCEEHEFGLINVITSIYGEDQQINVLHLTHNANNDVCYALILEHPLCYNISEILNGDSLYLSYQDSLYDLN